MNTEAAEEWSTEIRDYLLGRLATSQRRIALQAAQTQRLLHAPIRRWWMFEGKRYASLQGTLASRWVEALRGARLLERLFNPHLRVSERPDAAVDWGRTLARGRVGPHAEYVLHSSGIGLGEEEHSALHGWLRWVAAEWVPYAMRFKLTAPVAIQKTLEVFAREERQSPASLEQLRRWVHVARRSRWPFLRDVVAETLRPSLEHDALDHVPLPTDRSVLFELVCLVRIARLLAPPPDEMRWLDIDLGENKLLLTGVTCSYQQTLSVDSVLATTDFDHGLADAVPVFGLRVPRYIDLAFDFDASRSGINGIIVEAKSGGQSFDAATGQLRVYRRARPRSQGDRFLVWGIVEEHGWLSDAQLCWLKHEIQCGPGDVWVFSSADSIGSVLELLRS